MCSEFSVTPHFFFIARDVCRATLASQLSSGASEPSPLEVLVTQWCLILMTPWTVAHQAPPSMCFSWQQHWSGLPFPFPRNLPNPGIKPRSHTLHLSHQGSSDFWPVAKRANLLQRLHLLHHILYSILA